MFLHKFKTGEWHTFQRVFHLWETMKTFPSSKKTFKPQYQVLTHNIWHHELQHKTRCVHHQTPTPVQSQSSGQCSVSELIRSGHRRKAGLLRKPGTLVPHSDTPSLFLFFVCSWAGADHAWHIVSATKAKTARAVWNSYLERLWLCLCEWLALHTRPRDLSTLFLL